MLYHLSGEGLGGFSMPTDQTIKVEPTAESDEAKGGK
jgi:hypothetical protein